MAGDHKHDYSKIGVPVLAFVGFPELPTYRAGEKEITDPAQRIIIEADFGIYVAMAKNRIKRIENAAGGARVVELWGASHFVFLSNKAEVIRELKAFGESLQ
jgi:pimeloyl-ACP methyl ester carboxylesterase